MPMLALPAGEIHLWWARLDDPRHEPVAARQREVLSDGERERERRFVQPQHRREFRISHALVRETLSRYAGVSPESWGFGAGPHGRPFLAEPAGFGSLHFNLSHTEGLAVVAVASGLAVGVDVERTARAVDLHVAEDHFHPEEAAAVAREPSRFFEVWTLKEAYAKALGAGLTLPLRSFGFDLAHAAGPRLHFAPDFPGRRDAEGWMFHVEHRDGVCLALAAKTEGREVRIVEQQPVVPML